MTSGVMATRLGLSGSPPLAEVMLVERDIRLVEMTGGRLHLAKISTAESVKVIAAAKASSPLLAAPHTSVHLARWLAILTLYDLLFVLVSVGVFDYLLED